MQKKFQYAWLLILLTTAMTLSAASAWAAFGEDLEKPKPEFNQEGSDWIARLVPRGKSLSVQIRFQALNGRIAAIQTAEFEAGQEPAVDVKDFRSGFYRVSLDLPDASAAEATLVLASVYFNNATHLWAGNPRQSGSWKDTEATNVSLPDRVNTLTITVRDGGPLDADGQKNGRIEVFVGPHDSFWGYAIGTLFIRFFGIFIVLGILMLGMMLSGVVFRHIENRSSPAPTMPIIPTADTETSIPEPVIPAPQPEPAARPSVPPEVAAAVALALHLYSGSEKGRSEPGSTNPSSAPRNSSPSAWAQFGRNKLMADRLQTFDRIHSQPARTIK